MLIRSQDKKVLIPLEIGYPSVNYLKTTQLIFALPGEETKSYSGYVVIGNYSSEAKAIKVLDMICDAYERCERTDYQNIGYVGNVVFDMPTDEEVEG